MKARKSLSAVRQQMSQDGGTTSSVTASLPSSTAIEIPHEQDDKAEAPADWWADRHALLLLIALYAAQGLPMGLAFGSVPLLLKEHGSSYADMARFSLASLPYSVKIFIAPVVDSFYSRAFGRRKSWIVPAQLVIGLTMTLMASSIQTWVQTGNVNLLAPTFLILLAMTATQDIAVDGWSLTLLRKSNVSYASMCQSLGMSIGYFSTFTVFLAFSNAEFCDNYVRRLLIFSSGHGPLVDLRSALRITGVGYLFLTLYITFFKHEASEQDASSKKTDTIHPETIPAVAAELASEASTTSSRSEPHSSRSAMFNSIASTYSDLLVVTRKPAVRSLVFALLVAKFGFSAHDNVWSLKLLEVGFSKESMASMAVVQTPFALLGTLVTGRLVARRSPTEVYLYGFALRFALSLAGPACVSLLSSRKGIVTPGFYFLILSLTILYRFAGDCLMFVGIGAFFLNITSSSVHVAGSYLTLLNTSMNMGGIWHKALILWLVDKLTFRENCEIPPGSLAGTLCPVMYDGYYTISFALMPVAIVVGLHLLRTLPRLGKLPDSSWKASKEVL